MRIELPLLLLLANCATAPVRSVTPDAPLGWICQRHYPGEAHHFWVNKQLDSAGAHSGYSAGWRASASQDKPGTDLFWEIPESGPWYLKPDFVTLNFTLPWVPKGAVQARLYVDSRLIAQREVLDRRSARAFRRGKVGVGLFMGPGAGPVPLLHGVRSMVAIAVDEHGTEIASARPPLPDWAELDRRIAEALPGLDEDARDFEAKCERQTGPEI